MTNRVLNSIRSSSFNTNGGGEDLISKLTPAGQMLCQQETAVPPITAQPSVAVREELASPRIHS